MTEEERRISPAVAIIPVGLGLAALAGIAALAWAAPPPGKATLYGVVTDAVTGNPIAYVLVTLNGLEVYTDAGGSYAFIEIEPGEYSGFAYKEGYEEVIMGDIVLAEGDNELNISLVPIGVPVANLYGMVTDATTTPPIPIPDVKVTIDGVVTYTDASGAYGFEGLSPGAYTITFEKEYYVTETR